MVAGVERARGKGDGLDVRHLILMLGEERTLQYLRILLLEADESMSDLEAALASGDGNGVQQAAHKLNTLLPSVRATEAETLSKQIQLMAVESDMAAVAGAVTLLKKCWSAVRASVLQFLAKSR